MSAVTCPTGSANCNTINNCYLPTTNSPNEYTGLAAVNVDNAQDWRVYYYDDEGNLSELAGNSSGFDMGNPIGGLALNSSGIAAVNINSTTNNINVFYVDQLTEALYTTEFNGAWTTRTSLPPFHIITNKNQHTPSPPSASQHGTQPQVSAPRTHPAKTSCTSITRVLISESMSSWAATRVSRTRRGWRSLEGITSGLRRITSVLILLLLGTSVLFPFPCFHLQFFVGRTLLIDDTRWLDQVRFFQVAQNKMVEGSLNSSTWTESFVSSVQL
jgi:hypothetical protein